MKSRPWIILFGLIIAIPLGWYLISPLFINQTVNEAFPTAEPTAVMDMVSEEKANATQVMEDTMLEPTSEMSDPMPKVDMTILFQGEFYNLAHEGMGTATIYQLADGARILRLENFEVLNGPDLHVYLASQDPIPNTVGVELVESYDLGELKGNIGDQNYDLPADLDLSLYKSIVIWCQPFRVPFNAAPLQVPQP